jgi:hypothetical protein
MTFGAGREPLCADLVAVAGLGRGESGGTPPWTLLSAPS